MIGNSFLLFKPFQELSPTARLLIYFLMMESGGKKEFSFSRSSMIKKYGISNGAYSSAIKELIAVRYIERVDDDERLQYATARYRFLDDWKRLTVEEVKELRKS